MAIKSILKPEGSVLIGGVTVLTVLAVHGNVLPDIATMHATGANDTNIEAARVKFVRTSTILLGAFTLITRDVNIFILGGLTIVALDFQARHANAADNTTGELVSETTMNRQLSVVPAAG